RGRIVYANDAGVRMLGFSSQEELRQMPADEVLERFEILDEDGLPLDPALLPGRMAFEGRETERLIRFGSRPTGQDRWSLVCADPEKEDLARRLRETYPVRPERPEGTSKVLRSGEPELTEEVTPEWLEAMAPSGEQLEILRSLGLRSNLLVPLIARNRTLGVLTLATAESGRLYGEADLELAVDLARRAAVAV